MVTKDNEINMEIFHWQEWSYVLLRFGGEIWHVIQADGLQAFLV